MSTDKIQKKYKKLLLFSSLVLFVLGVFIRQYVDVTFYRLTGVFSIIVFFVILFLIHRKRISYMLAFFLGLHIISSLLFIWFEVPSMPTLIIAIHSISVLTLILYLLPKLKKVITHIKYLVLYTLFLLGVCGLLYILAGKIHQLDPHVSNEYYISLIVYMIFIFIFTFIVLLYNYKKSSQSSLVFVVFWLLFVFSNITYTLGYYKMVVSASFIHLSRLLFILSMSLLIHYTVVNEKEKPKNNIRYI